MLVKGANQTILRPKPLALLTHLARNPGRVVPKGELMDVVWPGIHVTEDSLTQAIREIRKALGDEQQAVVRTVARRGYMLAAAAEQPAPPSTGPVIAVLRFRNEIGDPVQDPFVDGITEDIIDGLARFRSIAVLARHSSFAISQANRDEMKASATRIGAQYLVEGAVRRGGSRVRVAVSLINAASLAQMWSDRFDAEGDAIFDAQQSIVERLVSRLMAHVELDGAARARQRPPASLAAYEVMLKGLALLRSSDRADFKTAVTLLELAVAKDPGYGLAMAHLAFAKVMVADFGRAARHDLDAALAVAARAAEVSPDQSTVHRVLSFVQMYRREHATAEHHLRRALDINPYDSENVEQMGYLLTLRGRAMEALDWIDRAVQLNPVHPPWYDYDRGFALYCLGEYRAAAESFERVPIPPPWVCTWLAASYAQLGDVDTARYHASRISGSDRGYWGVDFSRKNGAAFEHAADSQHFAEGVFLALGLPLEDSNNGH